MKSPRSVVAFDLETHLVKPREMAPRIVCLSFSDRNRNGIAIGRDPVKAWLEGRLRAAIEGKVLLVGQEVAFDFVAILANFPDLWDLVWKAYSENAVTDTAIRERLIDISKGDFRSWSDDDGEAHKMGYSLEDIALKRLKRKIVKDDEIRLHFGDLDGVDMKDWPKKAVDYSIQDAEVTFQIYTSQRIELDRIGYSAPTEFDEVRAGLALRLLSTWGIEVDVPRVVKVWNHAAERLHILGRTLSSYELVNVEEMSGTLFDSPTYVPMPKAKKNLDKIRAMIRTYHKEPIPLTDGGEISTAREVLEACSFEPLFQLVEFNLIQKSTGTYLSKLFESPIHARFYPIGAASDRTTCSNPNLQNQPRIPGIRECFIPRPGRVFLACDFDSQEMRTLAQSCLDIVDESKLAERYQGNRLFDPHTEFAARLAGVSPEEAERLKKAGDKRIKELRQEAKIANFGFAGGMSSPTLVDYAKGWGVEISEEKAKKLRDLWFQTWPEMRRFFDHVANLVGSASWGVVTIPQSGFKRAGVGYTDAANTYFQTLAAHASKAALWSVVSKCYTDRSSALYGSRPVLFIHDEIIVEVPEEAGADAAEEMERTLVASMEKWTPKVPAAASSVLMRRWSKKAERIFDKRGRLVPWKEPEK